MCALTEKELLRKTVQPRKHCSSRHKRSDTTAQKGFVTRLVRDIQHRSGYL